MKTSEKLVQKIKMLQRALGMEDHVYRNMLAQYNAKSSKELGNRNAAGLAKKLEEMAIDAGVWQDRRSAGREKYSEYDHRPEPMATGNQMRMIDAMWRSVSYIKDPQKRKTALDRFIKRITGKDALEWIEHKDVNKIVKAIKRMQSQQTRRA